MAKYIKTERGYIDMPSFAPAPFKPAGKSYLTFSSPKSFTLKVNDSTKHWDGTLEYFSADKVWTVWDGTTTLSSVDNDGKYVMYLRGTGNTVITGNNSNYRWILTGFDIACIGNIENLLDYTIVESGNHPTMATYCYYSMFRYCTSLTQAPALPATALSSHCYRSMFHGCTSLTQAPALPATTLADDCYFAMFRDCTSLTQAPALPATTLAKNCYMGMFHGCTSLTQAPALPATTLADDCYYQMFSGCTSLIQAPALPATTLSSRCYHHMFENCTSLTQTPALPATTLADDCYYSMFLDCTSLTQAPALPATTLAKNCYIGMFSGCTSLTQAPALPATTLADFCYYSMFSGCTSLIQVPALPATNLVNWCYNSMFKNCTGLKLSSTKTGEYTVAYRIPTTGAGSAAGNDVQGMFTSTGGTFTGTPGIGITYYLSTNNMIVRDTEVATLNGYVGSMINNSVSNPINITGATVGQIAKITAVDDSGKPTAWESVDMPGDGDVWELIYYGEITEDIGSVIVDKDSNGNDFSLKEYKLIIETVAATENPNSGFSWYWHNDDSGTKGPFYTISGAHGGKTLVFTGKLCGSCWYCQYISDNGSSAAQIMRNELCPDGGSGPSAVPVYKLTLSANAGNTCGTGSKVALFGVRA